MMKTFLVRVLTINALLALAACGGGDGGSGNGPVPAPPKGNLVLLAGDIGGSGNVDGLGVAARFQSPQGIAVDTAGNVYVTEGDQDTIRKITPAGEVSTFAGSAGSPGSADGAGAAARFGGPAGVATDSAGNVYVADGSNHTIRKITPAGVVSTLAGSVGAPGSADGAAAAARFNSPAGIAADSSGNLYVADLGNHTVRMITPAGTVSTLAGTAGIAGSDDGTGAAAKFDLPSGVSADGVGNVYVADTGNHTIRKIAAGGVVSTLAGLAGSPGSADGTGSSAQFRDPVGVATDAAGNIFVADSSNHIVRRITPAGEATTFAGIAGVQGADDGTGASARFLYPFAIAADSNGNLYVAEDGNDAIRKLTATAEVTTLAGAAALIGHVDAAGALARFSNPRAIVADAAGNAYIADGRFSLRLVTAAGDVTTVLDTLNIPGGLARDGAGNLYIADTNNHVIRKLDATGTLTLLAGTLGVTGSADGTGAAASFKFPGGVAVDAVGNVYVADTGNHTLRMISAGGVVTTLAGSAGGFGSADGSGASARFRFPQDLVSDAAGTLYVTDKVNFTIRKVAAGGVVTTLAGAAGSPGAVDGTGAVARFGFPYGIAMDTAGNLYVADASNHAIRKVTAAGEVTTVVGTPGKFGVQLGALGASLTVPLDVAVRADGELLIVTANGVVVTQGS